MASTSNAEASSSAFAEHSHDTRFRARAKNVENVKYTNDSEDSDAIVIEDEDSDDGDVFLSPSKKKKKKQKRKRTKPTPSQNVTSDRNNEAIHARILLEAAVRAFMTPFCAVTSYPDICSVVQICHVVSRRWSWRSIPWMRALEYVLGFPYSHTLNLDSRFNNILLKADYHCFFDHMGFILLPLDVWLRKIEKFVDKNISLPLKQRQYFLKALRMPKAGWEYVLLPLRLGSFHRIFVHAIDIIKGEWEVSEEGESYDYPFSSLPTIRSHVHPCYVMVNTWEKLSNTSHSESYPEAWTKEQGNSVGLCCKIVDRWMNVQVPPEFGRDPAATVPSQPVVDEDRSTPPPPSNGRTIDIADVHTLPDVATPSKAPSKGKGKARANDDPMSEEEEEDAEHFDSVDVAKHIHFEN